MVHSGSGSNAAASLLDDNGNDGGSSIPGIYTTRDESERWNEIEYNEVLRYVRQNSKATSMAAFCPRDIARLREHYKNDFERVTTILEKNRPPIEVNEDGVGKIVLRLQTEDEAATEAAITYLVNLILDRINRPDPSPTSGQVAQDAADIALTTIDYRSTKVYGAEDVDDPPYDELARY